MKILGIDPGTATTGYGSIRIWRKKATFLRYGHIVTPKEELPEKRLQLIYKEVKKIIRQEKPHVVSIERLFFFRNFKTAMAVSQAKGVILMACGESGLPVFEYTPLEVKKILVGYGRASKKEVQEKVKKLLSLSEIPKPDDAADALAIALCHGYFKYHYDPSQKVKTPKP